MQFIRFHEMENLLKNYTVLEGVILSLKQELGNLSERRTVEDIDDEIANLALGHASFDNVVTSSTKHISDKTAKTAMTYREILETENKKIIEELEKELIFLEMVFNKINIALNLIPQEIKDIIEDRCFKDKRWIEISDNYLISISNAQAKKKTGIEMITKISRISIQMYQQAMKILDL